MCTYCSPHIILRVYFFSAPSPMLWSKDYSHFTDKKMEANAKRWVRELRSEPGLANSNNWIPPTTPGIHVLNHQAFWSAWFDFCPWGCTTYLIYSVCCAAYLLGIKAREITEKYKDIDESTFYWTSQGQPWFSPLFYKVIRLILS